ncbi:MAG: transposase [Patescibacteria group bacterium]|nr:transposase [Patescibacteria group bacterium]
MSKLIVGIDIGKAKFDIALLKPNNKIKSKVFKNNTDGFNQLLSWLSQQTTQPLHFCMEATGVYGDALAHYLHDAAYLVSVVNPAQVTKAFPNPNTLKTKQIKQMLKSLLAFARPCSQRLGSPNLSVFANSKHWSQG